MEELDNLIVTMALMVMVAAVEVDVLLGFDMVQEFQVRQGKDMMADWDILIPVKMIAFG